MWKQLMKEPWTVIVGLAILFIVLLLLKHTFKNLFKPNPTAERLFKKTSNELFIDKRAPNESKGEIQSKEMAKLIFGKDFTKVRPDFLNNAVTGHNLELDIYNEELKLAIEYNGRQHYDFVPFFHKNREAFLNQKYRDEIKRMKCKEHGIQLIEIPYTVKLEDIETYIRIEAKKKGFDI